MFVTITDISVMEDTSLFFADMLRADVTSKVCCIIYSCSLNTLAM